ATVMAPPTVTPEPPRRVSADREELARRRARQIEDHLERAHTFLADGDHDAAIGACEQGLLLDAEDATALEVLDHARIALDERQAEEWLNEAAVEIDRGALSAALVKIDRALGLVPQSERAKDLRRTVDAALAAREEARRRAEQIRSLLARGHELFDQGLFSET